MAERRPKPKKRSAPRAKKPRREADSVTVSVLQSTLESTADGILVVDLEGKIVSHNRRFEEMWSLPAPFIAANDDAAGRQRLIEHVQIQLVNSRQFVDGIRQLYETPDGDSFDVLTFKDGRVFERYSIPLRLDGRSVGRVWSFRDVTARRRAECVQEAVYRISHTTHTADNLQQLLRAIHEIVGELMPAKNFYVALYDQQRNQLEFPYFVDEYDTARDVPPRKLRKGLTEYVLRTGRPLHATPEVHEQLVAAGEAELIGAPSIDWLGVPLTVKDRTIGIVAAQTYSAGVRYGQSELDILTFVSSQMAMAIERKRGEDALREQRALLELAVENMRRGEERYRAFIAQTSEGVSRLEVDPPIPVTLSEDEQIDGLYAGGRIAECNDAMARMYGYNDAQDLVGTRLADLHDVSDSANREQIRSFIRSGYRLADSETRERARDGRPRVFLNNVVGFIEEGRLVRVWGTQRDVSEQRHLEEQFRQSQKMEAVGQLAGGIAHDFNNLLTAILGDTQLLLRDLPPGDAKRSDVEEIRKASERAASLTRQLLAYSRRQMLQPEVLDLNGVVAEMDKMLRRLIGEHIALVTVLAPELGRVRADPNQLEQVLVNLAVNARDAMPDGGKLTIETSNVELDASFAQAHLRSVPGSDAMVAVTDTGAGEEPAVLSLSRRALEAQGYVVLAASDATDAMRVVERHGGTIHLLLTDVVMPGLSGPELADQLSARRPGIRVLYMSGYPGDAVVQHGALPHGSSFLQKPFSPDGLARKVRDVLDAHA